MRWQLVSVLIILVFFTPGPLGAASTSEIQQKIEQVKKDREALLAEQTKLQEALDATTEESQTLGATVKSLDATRKKLTVDINVTRSKITTTDLKIQYLENTMEEKEGQVLTHQKAISQSLKNLYQYDSRSIVLDLLTSTKFSDVWIDKGELDDLNIQLGEEIENLRETKKKLADEKEEKEKEKEKQISLKGQLTGQKSVIEENKKTKERLLAETKNKEAEYQKLLKENLASQKQFDEDLSRLETELQIILNPSLIPKAQPGILFWPLDNIFVTSSFGVLKTRIHNGIDFRASMGTPIKSVLSGVVTGVGNTDENNAKYKKAKKPTCVSYGGWILIDHKNGLSSVYAHLSASIVKTGQGVKTGEIIGYSGGAIGAYGSGNSSGPHLHLGIFATQGVEIRQLTNSRGGCKETYMPIALGKDAYKNPLDYLPKL